MSGAELADAKTGRKTWRNWSGSQTTTPAHWAKPESLADLQTLVRGAGKGCRVVGSGHSFTPIAATDTTLIDLSAFSGVRGSDPGTGRARLAAGARLRELSPALQRDGLAFRNLGDIDVQSLAGAVSTATHGTGQRLPCLAAEMRAATLVTADGALLRVDGETDPDLLAAVQVSLGLLGVLVEAEMAVVPAYRLRRRTWTLPLADFLSSAPDLWSRHRNFEAFYIPFSGHCLCIAHDLTDAPATLREPTDDDAAVLGLKSIRDGLMHDPATRREKLAAAFESLPGEDVVGQGWQLLSSDRNVPFNEMEYHLPTDSGLDVLAETIETVERHCPDVFFPIEVRQTAGDTAWLSPFQDGARMSIAVHAHAEDGYEWMMTRVEPLFRRAGGRPHWGKLHTLAARDLAALYPDFARFQALRRELDPDGRFLTPYLAALIGAG